MEKKRAMTMHGTRDACVRDEYTHSTMRSRVRVVYGAQERGSRGEKRETPSDE
jgi:hypothetical protein